MNLSLDPFKDDFLVEDIVIIFGVILSMLSFFMANALASDSFWMWSAALTPGIRLSLMAPWRT